MITKVSNLNKKSFSNYSGPDIGLEFKEKNIIFGYNGRGKSSLALGIVDEFLKNSSKTTDNYRLFDRKYVIDNLLLEPGNKSKIKGVVANFGKKDIDTERRIGDLETKIVDIKPLSDEILSLRTDTRKEIDNIHEQRKGSAEIQKKPANKTIEEVIKFYQEDVTEAKKIERSEDELLKIRGDNSFEIEKQRIVSLRIIDVWNILDGKIDAVATIFSRIFSDLIPTPQIIEWLNDGLKIHQDGDICQFCGGALDYAALKEKVNVYNANERQKSIKELFDFKKDLEKVIEQVKSLEDNKEKIIADLNNNQSVIDNLEIILRSKMVVVSHIDAIQEKIRDTSIVTGFDADLLKISLKSISDSRELIEGFRKDEVTRLDNKINNQAILVKGAIGVEISKNTLISNHIRNIPIKEKNLSEIERNNATYKIEIERLKKSKSTTKDFADHISDIFNDIGVNLILDLLDDDYIIKHPRSDEELSIDDISEGELNLLALLFFYYELFNDKDQQDFKNSVELIVVDDPISSVDDVNKMYVLELIKNLLNFDSQIFIFTHAWEDFCNVCYGRKDDSGTKFRFYEVKKDNSGSKIVKAKTNESPYRHHFKEVNEFSQKANYDDFSDCEIYHFPNVMRKIMEDFLSFKVKNNSATRANEENIKKVLCGDNPSSQDKSKVGVLIDVCNILSHKSSRNPDEILSSAKFLMGRIRLVDSQHYNSMVGE
jgi:wobble nucleotide-excising tRNase